MIYPSASLLQQAMAELYPASSQVPFFPNPVITDRDLVQQFQAFHQALEQGASPLEKESRLMWLASHLICRYGELRSPLPPLHANRAIAQQAQDYLRSHYQTPITLEDLAQIVGISPLKLLRLYRREWGLPPHRHLVQIRVQQAKRLIAAGNTLVNVAAATGFADQSHLNRHFKRLVGVTPGQYQSGC
jgi:AraC-like DNA-binding protein